MLRLSFVGCGFFLASISAAQSPSAPQGRAEEVTAVFHDGTIIRRAILPGTVEVTTRYGKLSVPVKDIKRIEFGFRLSAEMTRQIEEGIFALGHRDFRRREAASKLLIEPGARAAPALQKAAQSTDKEVARRAQAALEQIQQTVPAEQLQFKPEDTVTTDDCVLMGRVTNEVFKARTKTLGEMQFKLTDLRSLHSPDDAPGTTATTTTSLRPVVTYSAEMPTPTPPPPVLVPIAPPINAPQPAPALPPQAVPVPVPAPPAAFPQGFQFGFFR